MLDVEEATELTRAGYRLLRPLSSAGSGPWLAVREHDARPAVVRVVEPAESAVATEPCVEPVPSLCELLDVLTTPRDRIVVAEAFAERGALTREMATRNLSQAEAAYISLTLLDCATDSWARGGFPRDLTLNRCVVGSGGAIEISRACGWVWASDTAEVGDALERFRTSLRALAPFLPGLEDRLAPAELTPSSLSGIRDWVRQSFVPEPIGSAELSPRLVGPGRIDFETGPPEQGASEREEGSPLRAVAQRIRSAIATRWGSQARRPRSRLVGFAIVLAAVVTVVGLALLTPSPPIDDTGVNAHQSSEPSTVETSASRVRPVAIPADPVEAARVLFEQRASCRGLGAACFAEVDEPGSALLAEDVSRDSTGELPRAGFAPIGGSRLVSDMGGAVLVELRSETNAASVLLVQTEAAWRLRDVFG
ncbi:MAG TPA: hypothetical protein VK139_07400 [Microbacteriaceae bacterium]|nr:hypothetical protein [Microbacteriaceae bacterium]